MAPKCIKCCVSCVKSFPVFFIGTVILWSYYAYVVEMCVKMVDDVAKKILYLLFYHVVFILFMWSYGKTILTKAAAVPKEFYLESRTAERLENEESEDVQRQILRDFAKDLPVENRTVSGCVRYCEKCKCVKPDRAHHCSVCGTCILKMDHHCPWVNNCVCFNTYKFFILFLFYALVYCLFVAGTSLEYFVQFWQDSPTGNISRFHILFLFFVSIMFAISLSALFFYHLYLVSVNKSTLESFRSPIFRSGPDKDGYNIGRMNNIMEVFGDNKALWFVPIATYMGDGISFPTRINTSSNYNSMAEVEPPLGANKNANAKVSTVENGHVMLTIETPTIDVAPTPTPGPTPEPLPDVDVAAPASSSDAVVASPVADFASLSSSRSRERLIPDDETARYDPNRPTKEL